MAVITPSLTPTEERQITPEVLVIRVNDTWLALRAARLVRLLPYDPARLIRLENPPASIPALLGLLGTAQLPVLDLGRLLDLPASAQPTTAPAQVMVVSHGHHSVGFLIEAASEMERASLTDIYLLPPVIEQMRLRPVVWAIWQRHQTELIPLIEPLATLDPAEWELVAAAS